MVHVKRHCSVEQLVDIYKLKTEGYSDREITRRTGVPVGTVYAAFNTMDKYLLRGKKQPKFSSHAYKRAMAIIKRELDKTVIERKLPTQTATEAVKADKYEKIEQAFVSFQNAVAEFIKSEVQEKSADVQKQLDEANEKIKTLEPVIEKAKTSNFVNNLKNIWQ